MSEDLELEIARLKQANAELISRGADYLRRIDELETQHKKDVALMDIRQTNEYNARMELERYRWIPVSERLPGDRDWVIVAGEYGGVSIAQMNIKWGWNGADGETDGDVTHWMPLPEPPEDTHE